MPSGGDYEVHLRVLCGVGVRGGPLGFQAGANAGGRSGLSFTYLWPALTEARVGFLRPADRFGQDCLTYLTFPKSYDFGVPP